MLWFEITVTVLLVLILWALWGIRGAVNYVAMLTQGVLEKLPERPAKDYFAP